MAITTVQKQRFLKEYKNNGSSKSDFCEEIDVFKPVLST